MQVRKSFYCFASICNYVNAGGLPAAGLLLRAVGRRGCGLPSTRPSGLLLAAAGLFTDRGGGGDANGSPRSQPGVGRPHPFGPRQHHPVQERGWGAEKTAVQVSDGPGDSGETRGVDGTQEPAAPAPQLRPSLAARRRLCIAAVHARLSQLFLPTKSGRSEGNLSVFSIYILLSMQHVCYFGNFGIAFVLLHVS